MFANRPASDDSPQVTGEIIFDEAGSPFSGAIAYVRLEEVSRADAPARIVADEVLQDVSYTPGARASLAFALRGPAPDPKNRYSVRVHVDVDGDGQVSRGDFISMESYPVLTFGYPDRVTVQVKEIY